MKYQEDAPKTYHLGQEAFSHFVLGQGALTGMVILSDLEDRQPRLLSPLAVPGGLTQVVVTALVGAEALSKGLSQPHFHVILKELPGLRAGGVSLTLPSKSSKATVTCLRPQTAISRGRAQRLKLVWYLLNRSCNISASSFVPLKMFWVLKKV